MRLDFPITRTSTETLCKLRSQTGRKELFWHWLPRFHDTSDLWIRLNETEKCDSRNRWHKILILCTWRTENDCFCMCCFLRSLVTSSVIWGRFCENVWHKWSGEAARRSLCGLILIKYRKSTCDKRNWRGTEPTVLHMIEETQLPFSWPPVSWWLDPDYARKSYSLISFL